MAKNSNANTNANLNTILMNTIFISIIYNVFVLGYLLNLEENDCNCFRDWRHDFMKYYSIVLIVWGLINLSFNLYNSKNEVVTAPTKVPSFHSKVFVL